MKQIFTLILLLAVSFSVRAQNTSVIVQLQIATTPFQVLEV